MRTTIALLAVLLLVCGCIQEDEDLGRENSSIPTSLETTTTIGTTTSSQTTSTSTTTTIPQTCSQAEDNPYTCRENGGDAYCGDGWCKCVCPNATNTTQRIDIECDKYCTMLGYISGVCEVNMFECQVRQMVKPHYTDVLCIDARRNVCCCRTNRSAEIDSYLLNNAGKDGRPGLAFEEQK
jgi:hypothetical protein